ncbi:MAG TPA: tyrosine-type recombinase/integrase [Alphaproteobacteria bacterium]|nr:MAG: hypothetical protein B7X84_05810 [Alphaproteobacteria bacterium 17-39-52]HQS84489.1 tyrosine-type recombinase/integrase [Alphaproteobacteria bacterium]HQS93674.1 tyrosine-type recombinase/integrase [Alphaproteobacteria bacterium]
MSILPVQKFKITKRLVESIEPDPSKRLFLWDTEITGFCLRVYPTGRKTYFLQFRNHHHTTRKIKIGVHGNITAEQARAVAVQLSLEISSGKDPSIAELDVSSVHTIAALTHEYLELHAKVNKRPRSLKDDLRMITTIILPKLGDLKVDAVTSHDFQKLHKDLQKTPYTANRVRSLLSKMFNLAKEWGWCHNNPALSVSRYQEHKRTRFLNGEELGHLWRTLDEYPGHMTAYVFKFLILTGARKGEALGARWDQFDLEAAIWTKPSHLTKQKKTERLPLSAETVALLHQIQTRGSSIFVFPGKGTDQPLREIKTLWASVIKRSGLEGLRIHDLRHTYASLLVSQGLSLSIVGKLLGHTQAATTQRYAHLHDEPLRAATTLFGRQLTNLISQKA